jgi:hypothetical protein
MEGVGGRATRSTVSRGCPKGSVWRWKGRALARILGSATTPEPGPELGVIGTLVGAAERGGYGRRSGAPEET